MKVDVKLSHKEICYLILPLQSRIKELEFEVFKFGEIGNYPSLISFSKRLEKKLARLQKKSLLAGDSVKEKP